MDPVGIAFKVLDTAMLAYRRHKHAGNIRSQFGKDVVSRNQFHVGILHIRTDDLLNVKLGAEYADEGETIIVAENDGMIDVSQFIYEFIALSLPMKLVHEEGQCDEAMMAALEKLTPVSPLDEE